MELLLELYTSAFLNKAGWCPLAAPMAQKIKQHIVASELNDPICHSNECQIGSFSSEATIYKLQYLVCRFEDIYNITPLLLQQVIYINQKAPYVILWYHKKNKSATLLGLLTKTQLLRHLRLVEWYNNIKWPWTFAAVCTEDSEIVSATLQSGTYNF